MTGDLCWESEIVISRTVNEQRKRQNEDLPNGAGTDPKFSEICACERSVGIQKEIINRYPMRSIINYVLMYILIRFGWQMR